jgi:hypothetical protein
LDGGACDGGFATVGAAAVSACVVLATGVAAAPATDALSAVVTVAVAVVAGVTAPPAALTEDPEGTALPGPDDAVLARGALPEAAALAAVAEADVAAVGVTVVFAGGGLGAVPVDGAAVAAGVGGLVAGFVAAAAFTGGFALAVLSAAFGAAVVAGLVAVLPAGLLLATATLGGGVGTLCGSAAQAFRSRTQISEAGARDGAGRIGVGGMRGDYRRARAGSNEWRGYNRALQIPRPSWQKS